MRQLLNIAHATMVDQIGYAETDRILSGATTTVDNSGGEKQRAAIAMLDYVAGLES